MDNLSIQKIPDDFDELSLKTVDEAIQKARDALTISEANEQQLSKIPEFEATEFEEFGKEYKGGSMRYLYNTSSYEPEADHLYIYNDKLADSSLQPDGTVGTEVGWVELAFKHDVTAVSEKLESKTDKTDYADTENAGLIRLSSYDGKNNSGLAVNSENGIAYVNVRQDWGISRDSEGQIGINPATQTEVNAGTEERKPVTPKTLKTAVKTYEYRASDMVTGSLGTMRISFNDIELNRLFVLNYDDDSTGMTVGNKNQAIKDNQLLLYNDEVGYIVYGGFMEKGKKYLCMLTKYTVSGADPEDGELEVISEMQTAYTDTIQNLIEYSSTPVKIGTWVDGTPVWRWAFKYTFTDEDKSSTSGSIFSEKLYYIPYKNFLAKDYPVRLLDYNFLLTAESDNPNVIDDRPIGANSRYQQYGGFSTSWVVELPESGPQNFTGISGWIEFATPESNIKITR